MSFWNHMGLWFVISYPLSLVVVLAVLFLCGMIVCRMVRRAWRLVFAAALLLTLGACANNSDPPLTVIDPTAPTGELVPDHLDYGTLKL